MGRGRGTRGGKAKSSRRPSTSIVGDAKEGKAVRTMEDRLQSIEYHWDTFDPFVKAFLLRRPRELTLPKLLDFFSRPDRIAYVSMLVGVGTAHMLAHEYLGISANENAKALALCGAFFRQCQCPDTPIEKIMEMKIKDEKSPSELPFYYQGVQAVKNQMSTACYLKSVLPLKYQKMMGFDRPSQHAPGMGYVNLISKDWNGKSNSNPKQMAGDDDDARTITVVLSSDDGAAEYRKSMEMGATLKSLFNAYADDCGVSLRKLRFSHNGSTLFLSSIGQKSPKDLGMTDMDVIVVSGNNVIKPEENDPARQSKPQTEPQKKRPKSPSTGKGKRGKKAPAAQKQRYLLESNEARDKVSHSNRLSRVFEEMQPKLKIIRQQLNDLTLDRRSSKNKRPSARSEATKETPGASFDPSPVGVGGKAGRTSFLVNVGKVENLYLTSKRTSRGARAAKPRCAMANVDLHGCTKEAALERLEASLTEWLDAAMHGNYPWVIPANIVCGGGNQILLETVDAWIKATKNVANAPKSSFLVR
ncbi:hypothetical protein ACHAWF_010456 [Thalassiosira exigua]